MRIKKATSIDPEPVLLISDAVNRYFVHPSHIENFQLAITHAGELHLPNQLCGPFVKKELAYWGIDDNLIQPCCWSKYKDFEESELLLRQVKSHCIIALSTEMIFC